ncbi:MAG TPA: VanW family protein, partial [Cryptosporangiaceae bacterium]|nr:VanW family protein [Cryptosporangiaceae bacterium]
LIAGAAATAVFVVATVGSATYAYAGDVPRGTVVLGVDLGGMTRTEATQALRAGVARQAEQLAAPVSVKVGEQTTQVRPADVGLAVDVDATVAVAVRDSPNAIGRLFGSRVLHPEVTVDADRLHAALSGTAAKIGKAMTMPAITFAGTTPTPVYPRPGRGLDAERSAEALRAGWPGTQPVVVPLVELRPATTAEEVDRLLAEFARPAVAAPVTVVTPGGSLSIPPTAIASSLVLTADRAGKITPRVDDKKLRAALAGPLAKLETTPKDATVSTSGGRPRILDGAPGQQLDTAALSRDLVTVLPRTDVRQVRGTLRKIPPKTTAADLAKLGITERVSTFTTTFAHGLSYPRNQNIVRTAREVDGAVLKPGQTFSLNGHTGERGYAQGYQDAPVIIGGKIVPAVGGGISQFTTTLFNAAYYAGLEDVHHRPHPYWYSRYPPVIEATIFYPSLDLKFRNNTRYGVLIDTSYTSSSVTVSMWSTKIYDSVTTVWGPRRNPTKPTTVYLEPGPKCIATGGLDGFTQDAWRVFRQGGREIRRERFTWRYDPQPRYICEKKPA